LHQLLYPPLLEREHLQLQHEGLATATIHSFAKIGSPRALAASEASTSGERNSNFVAKAVFASGNTASETCCACTETEKSVMAAIIAE
jgi:hypothetical protein